MLGIIRDKSHFLKGACLIGTFFVLFYFMLTPLFPGEDGRHLTGLEYADEIFNELSKGSSYFIPAVREEIAPLAGKEAQLRVSLQKADLAPLATRLLEHAGVTGAESRGATISFQGDLGAILLQATEDADLLYHNNGQAVSDKYAGAPPLQVAAAWWYLLEPCIQELQKQRRVADAKIVDRVVTRAIEPGNNFYGILPARMSEHVALVCALLGFYVLYTLWYGFGIYELFEGVGLITVSRHEQEAPKAEAERAK